MRCKQKSEQEGNYHCNKETKRKVLTEMQQVLQLYSGERWWFIDNLLPFYTNEEGNRIQDNQNGWGAAL